MINTNKLQGEARANLSIRFESLGEMLQKWRKKIKSAKEAMDYAVVYANFQDLHKEFKQTKDIELKDFESRFNELEKGIENAHIEYCQLKINNIEL